MHSRKIEPPQQFRNGEDIQPNEARGQPKGAGIPIVHALPKPTKPKQRPHFGWRDGGGEWKRRQGDRTERNLSYSSAERMQHAPFLRAPRIDSNVPSGVTREPPIVRSGHCLPSNPYKRPKIEDTVPDTISHNDVPFGRKVPRVRKKKKEREWQTMVVEAPENCEKGAPHSSKHRGIFMRELVHSLKSGKGAVIKDLVWKDNQVVAVYAIDEKRLDRDRIDSDSKPCVNSLSVEGDEVKETSNIPSGLDVKIEDSPSDIKLDSGAQRPKETIICEDKEVTPVVDPGPSKRPHLTTYRRFKTGLLTLTHGSTALQNDGVPSSGSSKVLEGTNVMEVESGTQNIIDLTSPSVSERGDDEQLDIQDDVVPIPVADDDMTDLIQSQQTTRWQDKSFYITEIGDGVPLPRPNYDKPRRLLVSESLERTYVLSLHGRIHEMTRSAPRQQKEISAFDTAGTRDHSIDDACLLNDPFHHLAVVGETNEDNALTLVDLSENTERRISKLPRSSLQPDRLLRGVSAVHALPGSSKPRFIAGGYDHTVELWTVGESLSCASSSSLSIRHQSTIYSLTTTKDTPLKIISAGADCIVNIWDVASERTVKCLRTSNMVYHVHPTEAPGCILFEVAHRDSQFELHDFRAHAGRPSLRFGYVTPATNGRYMKGDIRGNTFVCGDRNGTVRQWDFRNAKEPLQRIEVFPGQKIVQTAFDGDAIAIVPEDNRLLFLDVREAS